MSQTTVTDKDHSIRQERLEALLALALDQPVPERVCPAPEMLVAWHEHRLNPVENETVLRHLNSCSDCYRIWSELADPLAEICRARTEKHPQAQNTAFHRFAAWLQSTFSPRAWAYGGIGGALGVALVVIMLLPTIRFALISRAIDQGFQELLPEMHVSVPPIAPSSPYVSKALPRLLDRSPWDSKSPSLQALAVGVRQGLEKNVGFSEEERLLLPSLPRTVRSAPEGISAGDWAVRERALTAAGRWAVLLHLACGATDRLPSGFWERQSRILGRLSKTISAYPEDDQFSQFFRDWGAQQNSPEGFCTRAAALMDFCRQDNPVQNIR